MRGIRTVATGILAVALTLVTVRAALAAPNLKLDPTGGPVGTPVTASGTGFSGSNVELFWDSVGGSPLASGAISGGEFELQFNVPSAKPDTHSVIACTDRTKPKNCREEAVANFTIPSPTTTTRPPASTTTTSTTTAPGTTTTLPPSTTTTTASEPIVTTTVPPFPPFPQGDDFKWTDENPPPPTQGAYSVPTTLPPPSVAAPDSIDPDDWPDLRATAIEITQGMQNIANDMPLVANRRTFARVYLDVIGADSWAPISGVLEVWDGGHLVGQLTPENPGATAWANGGSRLDLNDSLYFEIPLAWAEGADVRFSTLVWSFAPSTLANEPDDSNNIRHAFVDFYDAHPVTVHPAPLHLHRSYHPTDEIRTYTTVFGGGVYAQESGATSGALDVIEGLWRYHPVSSVSIDPYPSVLYPLDHNSGAEWNLGPCQTTYLGEVETEIDHPTITTRTFWALSSWEPFFLDPDSIDPDDLVADYANEPWGSWGLPAEHANLAILDKRYEVNRISIDPGTGFVAFSRTVTDSTGPEPIPGAPAFVGGCSPEDSAYSAPNQVMGLHRVWYDWDNETEYFLGMVDPSLPSRWGGLASSGSDAAWAKFDQTVGDIRPWSHKGGRTVGHELGHLTGLEHAPCKDSDGDGLPDELAGGALDMTHPGVDWFPDCQLGEIDPEGFFGFDVYFKLFGLDEPTVISPDPASPALNLAFPLMGYKSPKWTDPFHWCRMLEHYGVACNPNLVGIYWNPPPPEPTDGAFTGTLPPMPAPGSNRDVAYILGTLPNPADDDDEPGLSGVTIFTDVNVIPGCHDCWINVLSDDHPVFPPGNDPAAPWIEVWGRDGSLIQRTPLLVELEHSENQGPVEFQTPIVFEPGATIRVVDSDGAAMGETKPDVVPIEVAALSLTGVHPSSGRVDLDGPWDDLPEDAIHTLQYSADGEHWLALESRRGSPITEIDPGVFDRLPGSDNGHTRMLISAGWSGGIVVGPDIEIPNKPPVIMLQLPLDQAAYAQNELVEMAASALDPEDRDLSDQIQWTSSIDGHIGAGPTVASWTLSPGKHQMTATVTDSSGLSSHVSSTIAVSGDLIQAILSLQDQEIIAGYLSSPADDANGDEAIDPAAQPEDPGSSDYPDFLWNPVNLVLVVGVGIGVGVGYFVRRRRLEAR